MIPDDFHLLLDGVVVGNGNANSAGMGANSVGTNTNSVGLLGTNSADINSARACQTPGGQLGNRNSSHRLGISSTGFLEVDGQRCSLPIDSCVHIAEKLCPLIVEMQRYFAYLLVMFNAGIPGVNADVTSTEQTATEKGGYDAYGYISQKNRLCQNGVFGPDRTRGEVDEEFTRRFIASILGSPELDEDSRIDQEICSVLASVLASSDSSCGENSSELRRKFVAGGVGWLRPGPHLPHQVQSKNTLFGRKTPLVYVLGHLING